MSVRPLRTGDPFGRDDSGDRGYVVRVGDSTHYRYGYVVEGAEPRYCGIKDDRATALQEAAVEATHVHNELKRLGAPTRVSAWIQTVTATTTVRYPPPELEPITEGQP